MQDGDASSQSSSTSGRERTGVREVEYLISQNAVKSVSLTASELGMPRSQFHVLLRELKMHAYKEPRLPKLTADHIAKKLEFAQIMLSRLRGKYGSGPHREDIDVNNICFTDECVFGIDAGSNRQNDRIWRERGAFDPYEAGVLKETTYQGSKICVFVLVHARAGIIGPYFADDFRDWSNPSDRSTLDSAKYITMLRTKVVPELRRRLGDSMATCWFQQDGAAIHTSRASLQYLRSIFGFRLISLKSDCIEWPACSPDLSPLDYWFWARMKSLIR